MLFMARLALSRPVLWLDFFFFVTVRFRGLALLYLGSYVEVQVWETYARESTVSLLRRARVVKSKR